MAKEKEIIMMHFEGYSQRDICAALKCGHTKAGALIGRAREISLDRESASSMDDAEISRLLALPKATPMLRYAEPDFEMLAKELEKPDVTRKLLWYEYCNNISDKNLLPYQYSQFCKRFEEHLAITKATYRLKHDPGKRMFVDWAGSTGRLTNPVTGETIDIYVFVACLPYSAMLFAEGFTDMKQGSWADAHIHAFEWFGGVPGIVVPDNAKTAVNRNLPHAVLINESYDALAAHYGCAVIPARPGRPNDKAMVENGVNIVEKSVLAALRNETFFTLAEFNAAVARRISEINAAPFQRRPGTRLEIFNSEERHLLKPLPGSRFEQAVFKRAKVSPDYHIQVESMRYSVPYTLISKECDVRVTSGRIDVLHGGEIVASHARLYGRKGQYSTDKGHMPAAHAAYDAKWTPERYISWAGTIGPATKAAVESVISSKAVVEQAFVPCMNILGLAKKGRRGLLEQACGEIMEKRAIPTYSLVKNTMEAIKTKGRMAGAAKPTPPESQDALGGAGYVRGNEYYGSIEGGDGNDI